MDGNSKMNGPELPKPQPTGGSYELSSAESSNQAGPESMAVSPIEMLTQAQGAVVQAVQTTNDNTALPMVPINDPHSSASQSVTDDQNPIVAEDGDVLEKVWVERAKKVVEATKDDPHQQTNQFVKMRYDYVKKRYGKEMILPSGNQGT